MNCYLHPESPAVAFCRTCGRSLCTLCQRPAEGTIYCQDHVPVPVSQAAASDAASNPYLANGAVPPAPVRTSPGLAFILGFIPGVGAIYNGQYLKGLVHALIFGLLVTIVSGNAPGGMEPLIGILLAAFVFYMPFEAYHTAKKRELGVAPDEWSSILPQGRSGGRAPIGPIVLIAIGVLYLLNTLDLVNFHQIGRFWPVILIVVGAYMLYSRVTAPHEAPRQNPQTYPNSPGSTPPADLMGTRHE